MIPLRLLLAAVSLTAFASADETATTPTLSHAAAGTVVGKPEAAVTGSTSSEELEQLENAGQMAKVPEALRAPIVTVVDKPQASPSGDAHDYVSYARYYWPDPTKPDGLPYINHDGHHNRSRWPEAITNVSGSSPETSKRSLLTGRLATTKSLPAAPAIGCAPGSSLRPRE